MVEGRRSRHMFSYVRKFRNDAREKGLPIAAHEALKRARVNVHIEGNTEAWRNIEVGVLFLGDHKKGLEQALLADAFGQAERDDIHFLGLPFAISRKLARYFTGRDDIILPVTPGYLARKEDPPQPGGEIKDKAPRRHLTRKQRLSRLFFGQNVTPSDLRTKNDASLQRATDLLAVGDAIGVMPTGAVGKGIESFWHTGAAKILADLPVEKREKVIVAPFSCDENFSPLGIYVNLGTKTTGIRPLREKNYTIKFGDEQKTAFDIIGTETDLGKITIALKKYYFQNLGLKLNEANDPNINPNPHRGRRR